MVGLQQIQSKVSENTFADSKSESWTVKLTQNLFWICEKYLFIYLEKSKFDLYALHDLGSEKTQ